MSNKPLINGSSHSPWQVLASANAYYALSNVFTGNVPKSIHDPAAMNPDLDEAAASATNRILATELYLKALLIGANAEFPADHDLPTLFQCLRDDIRIAIETGFNRIKSVADDPNCCAEVNLWFQLTKNPEQSIETLAKPEPTDATLAGLLKRNRRGFIDFRYLFDKASYQASTVYVYEHLRLAILCSVLCELLESSLQNRSKQYKRTFSFGSWDA